MAKVVVVDCQIAGIAGDMLVSALVDAGASAKKVQDAIFACQDHLKGSKITKASFEKISAHGLAATQLKIICKDAPHHRKASELVLGLTRACDALDLEQRAKAFALNSLKTIISAEAKVHGEGEEDFNNVHLHEASSIDTLADIVGAAAALQSLSLFGSSVFSTNVAVGGGNLTFSHGTVPNPADAILRIFQGRHFSIVGGPTKGEFTTPTGAALLVNLAEKSVDYYPSLVPEKIGYGAGCKSFSGISNVVRILIGESAMDLQKDVVCLIETNVDDATGELMGNLVDRLTDAGAKDITIIPGTTKKSRPAYIVRVIADSSSLDSVLKILFSESGTLGARVQYVDRYILPRTILTVPVTVGDDIFNVRVKVAKDGQGNTTKIKPEFEDIKLISLKSGLPARNVLEIVNSQVAKKT